MAVFLLYDCWLITDQSETSGAHCITNMHHYSLNQLTLQSSFAVQQHNNISEPKKIVGVACSTFVTLKNSNLTHLSLTCLYYSALRLFYSSTTKYTLEFFYAKND